jgi:hypothetical protein
LFCPAEITPDIFESSLAGRPKSVGGSFCNDGKLQRTICRFELP